MGKLSELRAKIEAKLRGHKNVLPAAGVAAGVVAAYAAVALLNRSPGAPAATPAVRAPSVTDLGYGSGMPDYSPPPGAPVPISGSGYDPVMPAPTLTLVGPPGAVPAAPLPAGPTLGPATPYSLGYPMPGRREPGGTRTVTPTGGLSAGITAAATPMLPMVNSAGAVVLVPHALANLLGAAAANQIPYKRAAPATVKVATASGGTRTVSTGVPRLAPKPDPGPVAWPAPLQSTTRRQAI